MHAKFGFLLALRAFELRGIFIVPNLLWHRAWVFPVSIIQRTTPFSRLFGKGINEWLLSFYVPFKNFSMIWSRSCRLAALYKSFWDREPQFCRLINPPTYRAFFFNLFLFLFVGFFVGFFFWSNAKLLHCRFINLIPKNSQHILLLDFLNCKTCHVRVLISNIIICIDIE
jgi:hypothetical protein